MSVVIDAVNNFFGPPPSHSQYSYHEAPRVHNASPPLPKRSRTSPKPDTPMSTSGRRASSSSVSNTAHQQHVLAQSAPRASAQATQQNAPTPSSPPLAASDAPPPEGSEASIQAASTPTARAADTRQARPAKIKVRDLEHIQSFASENMGAFSEVGSRSRSTSREAAAGGDEPPQYEISEMKVEHIIEMVAGLLTKITTTNDQQHEHLHRQPPHLDTTSHLNPQTSSVLAFHGKNVPSITILSYLTRINKYCPTSYEVFLSLLVYFDRMTERVNAGPMQTLRQANEAAMEHNLSASSSSESIASDRMEGVTATTPQGTQTATPPSSGGLEKGQQQGRPGTPHSRSYQPDSPSTSSETTLVDPYNLSHFFVVDSFNIHRLVIAGVGGLPLPELNHLELQFLLLNDFRLSVPVEEIEAYGTMLVEFYAREVLTQQKAAQAQAMQARSLSESSSDSTSTVRAVA
ncbi:cyclin-like protein interacting with PHO85 [Vermiconidia calcicola]|uniref:Cyclin-like protein interacting with PHO85 n=1 Tax=Vermiconidia calcicola TaxID=1690605 RepID=A0ACC3NK47_9PEZI|nr:cyclin-like protein interacting with PHO85 [Vermiconidia calcicola]